MNKKRAGVIECGEIENISYAAHLGEVEGFYLEKILRKKKQHNTTKLTQGAGVELVDDVNEILHDTGIDLVIISGPGQEDMEWVGQAIQSGKSVRII